jgi:uncharacterized membrane protein
MVNRAFDKIRQAATGMPAVMIRILVSLAAVAQATTSPAQRDALLRQGEMVLRSARESVTEQNDLDDIQTRFNRLQELISTLHGPSTT